MQTITVSASAARSDLFNLIDMVAQNRAKVLITKRDTDMVIVQKAPTTLDAQVIRDQKNIVQETKGALKTDQYYPDEFKRAEKVFVQEYKQQHGLE